MDQIFTKANEACPGRTEWQLAKPKRRTAIVSVGMFLSGNWISTKLCPKVRTRFINKSIWPKLQGSWSWLKKARKVPASTTRSLTRTWSGRVDLTTESQHKHNFLSCHKQKKSWNHSYYWPQANMRLQYVHCNSFGLLYDSTSKPAEGEFTGRFFTCRERESTCDTQTCCRVEDMASSHAGNPAFGEVLSTQWSCFCRAVRSQSCSLSQYSVPVYKTCNMMHLPGEFLSTGVSNKCMFHSPLFSLQCSWAGTGGCTTVVPYFAVTLSSVSTQHPDHPLYFGFYFLSHVCLVRVPEQAWLTCPTCQWTSHSLHQSSKEQHHPGLLRLVWIARRNPAVEAEYCAQKIVAFNWTNTVQFPLPIHTRCSDFLSFRSHVRVCIE